MTAVRVASCNIKISIIFFIYLLSLLILGYLKYAAISFMIVIIHELSHIFLAYILGYRVEEIEIFPLGGIIKLDRLIGVNPIHEGLIAGVGPLSNFIMALLGYFFLINGYNNEIITYFVYANLIIAITNLIPVLPLDGGRIARSYLAYLIGIKKATKIIILLSKIISIFIFILGLYLVKYNSLNLLVCFLAIFIITSLRNEKEMAVFIFMKEVATKKTKKGLNYYKIVVRKDSTLKDVINDFRPRKYHVIIVVDEKNNIIAKLTEREIIEGVLKYGLNSTIDSLF